MDGHKTGRSVKGTVIKVGGSKNTQFLKWPAIWIKVDDNRSQCKPGEQKLADVLVKVGGLNDNESRDGLVKNIEIDGLPLESVPRV